MESPSVAERVDMQCITIISFFYQVLWGEAVGRGWYKLELDKYSYCYLILQLESLEKILHNITSDK